MKNKRFNSVDWSCISAYAHGYAHGAQGLELDSLYPEPEYNSYELMGWEDGLQYFFGCGDMRNYTEEIDMNIFEWINTHENP